MVHHRGPAGHLRPQDRLREDRRKISRDDAGLPHPSGPGSSRGPAGAAHPPSYFLASDMYYAFMAANGLIHWSDQKYKSEAEMRTDYPKIVRDFVKGTFPADILERLRQLLEEAGERPLIVRSSSPVSYTHLTLPTKRIV